MPYVTPKSIQFGVRIPRERESDPIISEIRRGFHTRLIIGTIVVFLTSYIIPLLLGYYFLTLFSLLPEMILTHVNYYLSFRRLHRTKVKQEWYDGISENVGVLYPEEVTLKHVLSGVYFIFPSIVILVAAISVGITGYANFPSILPSNFTFAGVAKEFTQKSFLSVFFPTIEEGLVTGILFTVGLILVRTRQEIDVSRPYTTYEQQTRFKTFYRDALYVFVSLYGMTALINSLRRWEYPTIELPLLFVLLPLILGFAVMYLSPYLIGQMGSRLSVPGEDLENSGASNKDDDTDWKGGMFDFNRQDPSLLVGKRFGIGWTLNFANPRAWVVLGAAISAVVLVVIMVFVY